MRCKKHLSDLSSSFGVCASCLRERLFALIATQAQAQAQQAQLSRALSRTAAIADQDPRKSDPNPPPPPPPPLAFPRSVSPYVSRRKSDGFAAAAPATWSHNQQGDHHPRCNPRHLRFYSTPQVGPTFRHSIHSGSYKKKKSRFSLLSKLFRSRSEKFESDPRVPYPDSYAATSSPAPSSPAPSWFSAIFASRKDRLSSSSVQSQFFVEDSSAGVRHRTKATERGMSPARGMDFEYDYDEYAGEQSPSVSGRSSESSPGWKKTPTVALPSARRSKPGQSRNVSGLAFCLSPLVRASPNRHWNQKGMPQEIGKSGEARVSGKPHLSNAASFCKNRSRKLADFGRANHNR